MNDNNENQPLPPSEPTNAPAEPAPACQEAGKPACQTDKPAPLDARAIEELRKKADERDALWNRLVRAHADFDNWRKRIEREMANARRFALQEFIVELLPVLDSLELALRAAESIPGSHEALIEGVRAAQQKFHAVLKANNIEPVPAIGEKFNPEIHEAIAVVHTADQPPFTVIEEQQKGFRLHDRLIRPALVIVAAGKEDKQPPPTSESRTPPTPTPD